MVCLFLSIRLAHASLSRKLSARKERKPIRDPPGGPTVGSCLHRLMVSWAVAAVVVVGDGDGGGGDGGGGG